MEALIFLASLNFAIAAGRHTFELPSEMTVHRVHAFYSRDQSLEGDHIINMLLNHQYYYGA